VERFGVDALLGFQNFFNQFDEAAADLGDWV
jgi:hypothetical protein